jgi:hypothetical membrane protein
VLSTCSCPPCSWAGSALSDLGVKRGITAPLFNYGLIAGGISALIFAAGSPELLHKETVGKMGAPVLGSSTIALILIGIFPVNAKSIHYYVSVAFFVLFPAAMSSQPVSLASGN